MKYKDQWPKWAFMHRTMDAMRISEAESVPYTNVRFALMHLGIFRKRTRNKRAEHHHGRKIDLPTEAKMIEELRTVQWPSMTACGAHYGITRERVRQIIRANGLAEYALRLPDYLKRARRAVRVQISPHTLSASYRLTLAHAVAEMWNDPTIPVEKVGEEFGMVCAAQRVHKLRNEFPGIIEKRKSGGSTHRNYSINMEYVNRVAALWADRSIPSNEAAKQLGLSNATAFLCKACQLRKKFPDLFPVRLKTTRWK